MASRNRSKRAGKAEPEHVPTPEQLAGFALVDIVDKGPNGQSIEIGRAYRRVPVIDRLREEGFLSRGEHDALKHYRHHADTLERSPIRDSLCIQRGGGGNGPTLTYLSASCLVGQVERAVGSLVDILRAVVVDDLSLSEWAIRRHGGIVKTRMRKGQPQTVIEPTEKALRYTRQDMKHAAVRVEAELSA